MDITHDTGRLIWAAGTAATFGLVCLTALWPRKGPTTAAEYLVLYASQSGQAEDLARQAHTQLVAGGLNAALLSLGTVTVEQLRSAQHILCIASTTGEGDAPDDARPFERRIMATRPDLTGQAVAVLALGDRKYEQFAAFGRRLFDWFSLCGATSLLPCLTADDLDPEALRAWNTVLHGLGAASPAPTSELYQPWHMQSREHLNPQGSAPLYRVRLISKSDPQPQWQAGDLAEILTPDGHRRDYSIASLCHEGHIELYVREVRRPDGTPGSGSGLLIHDLPIDGGIDLRLKSHNRFHTPDGDGPVLLIGAGSGLAGLRGHILNIKGQRPTWLIYGERHPTHDAALIKGLTTWRADGLLNAFDLAFSQPDSGMGRYVQDVLTARADDIRTWLAADGAIMVCGGLAMGQAVESRLRHILGEDWIENAIADGRFRRDLY